MKKDYLLMLCVGISMLMCGSKLMAQGSVVTMKTTKAVGESMIFLTEGEITSVTGASLKGGNEYVLEAEDGVVSIHGNINILVCSHNQLTSLDLSNNLYLQSVTCTGNQLTELDVRKNTELQSLICDSNRIASIDISNLMLLASFDCKNNELTELDVSKNSELVQLFCADNKIKELNVSNCPNLVHFYCVNNELTELDVTNNLKLQGFGCAENNISTLDLSKNTDLWSLFCSGNKISSLDLSNNQNLSYVFCDRNEINEENMGKMVATLADRSEKFLEGELFVYDNTQGTEKNICTTAHVEKALALNWLVYEWNGSKWVKYPGSESTGIDNNSISDRKPMSIYSLDGYAMPQLRSGMNIIKMNDGSVRKVSVGQ